jgi:F-type H+-transporting ATPase subunit b
MLIDGVTVAAQFVNFLVLVGLLRRYLYRPVLAAVERREKGIAAELAAAAESRAAASRERESWAERSRIFEQERSTKWQQAEAEIARQREALLARAQEEVRRQEALWREALAARRRELEHDLARRALRAATDTLRQMLTDLAGVDLETRLAEVLVARVRAMPGPDRERLRAAFARSICIRSSRPLSDQARQEIELLIGELGGPPPRYEVDESRVVGLLIRADSFQLSWDAADYLGRLIERLDRALEAATHGA